MGSGRRGADGLARPSVTSPTEDRSIPRGRDKIRSVDPVGESESIEIQLFLEGIHARYGYDLREYARPSMHRRVMAALAASGAPHLGELLHRVLHDRELFAEVLERLTVRVSELFRDPSFFQAYRTTVIPLLRTYPMLKIWHAGCATGEEAYSSAILLREEGLYERTQIYATDLSPRALQHAKDGVYPVSILPSLTTNHEQSGGKQPIEDHVTEAYGQIAIREPLKKNILFFQHDLVTDHVFGEMHVVFCRNVLFYFGGELRQRVVRKLAQSLIPGGFMCLGTSERPPDAVPALKRFGGDRGDLCIYRYEP